MPQTLPFSRIAFFGDSLTDNGNLFDLTSSVLQFPLPSPSSGYAGAYSNGAVYADIAPGLLGLDEVDNFAVGGARAVGRRTVEQVIDGNGIPRLPIIDRSVLPVDINLGAQMQRFVDSAGSGGVPAGTAASLFIGLNDYNNFVPSNPLTALNEALVLLDQVITQTLAAADAALAAGADTIIFNTLPGPAFFPASAAGTAAEVAFGQQLIDAHNAALMSAAEELAATGVNVMVVDFAALSDEIADDPTGFGFIAPLSTFRVLGFGEPVVTSTLGGLVLTMPTNPASTPFEDDQIAFWDALHPTAAMHGVWGSFMAASLSFDTVDFLGAGDQTATYASGSDLVFAGAGNDRILLGGNADIAFGGQDDDRLHGQWGQDILAGGSGDDMVFGGRGADIVTGGEGDDVVMGERGGDVVFDGLGSDVVYGGYGRDALLWAEAELIGGVTGTDTDLLDGGGGYDTVYLALTDATRTALEADIEAGNWSVLSSIGLDLVAVEDVVILDSRADFSSILTNARLDEADLWNIV